MKKFIHCGVLQQERGTGQPWVWWKGFPGVLPCPLSLPGTENRSLESKLCSLESKLKGEGRGVTVSRVQSFSFG